MKWIFVIFAGLTLSVSCNSGTNNQEQKATETPAVEQGQPSKGQTEGSDAGTAGAVLTLENDSYDFGEVKEGEKVEHEFAFTNTGTEPLIISRVQASCGCTTPEYSKNPIAAGEKGTVKVVFNSAGQMGKQQKIITITSNADKPNTIVKLRGEVKK